MDRDNVSIRVEDNRADGRGVIVVLEMDEVFASLLAHGRRGMNLAGDIQDALQEAMGMDREDL